MIRYFLTCCLLVGLFTSLLVCGQTYQGKSYTVDEGLPSTEIFHVIQDKKGYIWVATNQGVSRYDGYQFVNFDDQAGLPRNTILEVFEDNAGRIWFVSLMGELSWFENDTVHTYSCNHLILDYNKNNNGRPLKGSFYADSTNEVYMGFNMKPLIKISDDGILTEISYETDIPRQVIVELPDQSVLFSSYKHSLKGFEIQSENKPTRIIDLKYNYAHRFMARKINQGYLFAVLYDLFFLNNDGVLLKYSFDNKIIWLSQDSEGIIWVGFLGGGVKAFTDISFSEVKFNLLNNESVSSVERDIEGGYWFSTIDNGLFYFPTLKIESITEIDEHKLKSVDHIENYNGEIWFVGNNNELYKLNNGAISNVNLPAHLNKPRKFAFFKSFGDSISMSFYSNQKNSSVILKNGKEVWNNSIVMRHILPVGKDILLSGFNRLLIYRPDLNDKYEVVSSDQFIFIYAILQISKDTFWIGTENGIFEYSYKRNTISKVVFSDLLRSRINCFNKDDNGIIWVGTKGAGLLRISSDSIYQITKKEGLSGNSINTIQKKNRTLWLATNNGVAKVCLDDRNNFLFRVDSEGKQTENIQVEYFNKSFGLINNEVFDLALYQNNVYAGTDKGLCYFSQNLSGVNTIAPPIAISGVKIMNKDTVIQDDYELEYNQNYIEFRFIALSYQREEELEYAYFLEGVNNDWIITKNRTVHFPMLPPGDYVFKVKAFNRSGIESEIKSIKLKIKKAYYQRLTFKLVALVVLLLMVALIYTYIFYVKMREIKKRNSVINELNKFRQRALSAQMNPHFIFNSLNSVQSYILTNDREKSSTYLSKFGKLMRKVLDNSQNPVITLYEELEALKVYVEMELIRFHNCFNFQLKIDDNIKINQIEVPPLIIQPYVENAIHHGLRMKDGEKKLSIDIRQDEKNICIFIEDNGIGRKESQQIRQRTKKQLKSYGTEITNKRMSLFKELYKNDVDIKIIDLDEEFEAGSGTRVEIYMNKSGSDFKA